MNTKFTAEFIAELRALAEQATPRPWEAHNTDDALCMNDFYITREGGPDVDLDGDLDDSDNNEDEEIIAITLLQYPRLADEPRYEENTHYIIAAANELPAALDEIEALQSEIERLRVELQSKAIIIENQQGTINNQAEKILVALKGR